MPYLVLCLQYNTEYCTVTAWRKLTKYFKSLMGWKMSFNELNEKKGPFFLTSRSIIHVPLNPYYHLPVFSCLLPQFWSTSSLQQSPYLQFLLIGIHCQHSCPRNTTKILLLLWFLIFRNIQYYFIPKLNKIHIP